MKAQKTILKRLNYRNQVAILEKCIRSGKKLDVVLAEHGLTYDDLSYKHEALLDHSANVKYKRIDDIRIRLLGIPVVSFFAGCGGLDLGFERAGFNHVACIDNNENFCNTIRANRPKWNVIGPPVAEGDISNRNKLHLELQKFVKPDFNGVFIGGPPCQPFSIAANQRFRKGDENYKRTGFDDEQRGNLLFDYIWFIKKFKPKVFLVENVTGLLSIDEGMQLEYALKTLSRSGYKIAGPVVLDAADFGVPQRRKRLFIIGSRSKEFLFPSCHKENIPCVSAFASLDGASNHVTRKHNAESIARYMELQAGKRDHSGRVNRLEPNKPSLTVIAGGTGGGGRSHLHPLIPRTLSVRECARLQTFPDDFTFYGPIARQFTQVGNAVPPLLAYYVAEALAKQLF